MPDELERLLTAAEVAEILGVGVETVHAYVRRGELACRRVGPRLTRFAREDIRALVGEAVRQPTWEETLDAARHLRG